MAAPHPDSSIDVLTVVRECLSEDRARFERVESLVDSGLVLLVRRFSLSRGLTRVDVLSFADTYVSAANAAPSVTVENPQASGEVFPGVWRLRSNVLEFDPQTQLPVGLVQTLARGVVREFSWSSVRAYSGETAAAEFRAVGSVAGTSQLDSRILEIPFCDVRALETILNGIPRTATDPEVCGQRLAGTWVIRSAAAADLVSPASVGTPLVGLATVRFVLAREAFGVELYERYGLNGAYHRFMVYDVPLSNVQGLVDWWVSSQGAGSGASLDYNYDRKSASVLLYKREAVNESASASGVEGAKDAAWYTHLLEGEETRLTGQTAPSVLPAEAPNTTARVENRLDPDTGRWIVATRIERGRNVGLSFEYANAVESAQVSIETAAPFSSIPAVQEVPGTATTLDVDPTEFLGRFRYRRIIESAREVTTQSKVLTALGARQIEEKTAVVPQALPNALAPGTFVELYQTPTKYFGRVQVRQVIHTAQNVTVQSEERSALETRAIKTQTAATETAFPDWEDGTTQSVVLEPTDYAQRYRRVEEIRTAINAVGGRVEADAFESRSVVVETASPDASLSLEAQDGKMVAVQVDPLPFKNRFRRTTEVRSGKAVENSRLDTREDAFVVETSVLHRNIAPPLPPFTVGTREIRRRIVELTPYTNRVNVVDETETAKQVDDLSTQIEYTAYEVREVRRRQGRVEELWSFPSMPPDDGVIETVERQRMRHAGAWAETKVVRQLLPAELEPYVSVRLHNQTEILRRRIAHAPKTGVPTWGTVPESLPPGHGVVLRRALNEGGGYTIEREDVHIEPSTRPLTGWFSIPTFEGHIRVKEWEGIPADSVQGVFNEVLQYLSEEAGVGRVYDTASALDFDPTTGTYRVRVELRPRGGGATSGNGMFQVFFIDARMEKRAVYADRPAAIEGLPPETWVRQETYYWGLAQHPSLNTLLSWLDGRRGAFAGSTKTWTEEISPLGTWGYRAKFVVKTEEGAWTRVM